MPTEHASMRDPRVDVFRGLALLMIFIDHIPGNVLSLITIRNFGFSDAAEIFVLLAGFSSMLAYGGVFDRKGAGSGLRRILSRLARLYLFQIGLLLTTLGVVFIWTRHFQMQPVIVGPILNEPVTGLAHALTLHAVPTYLDILPLYIALLAVFPLIYAGLRSGPWLTLILSAAVWLIANLDGDLNLPNWMNGKTWTFDPFAWQFLFTIGAAFAMLSTNHGGALPRTRWLTWLCGTYLGFAFVVSAPWADWHLPALQVLRMPTPEKTHLDVLRLLDMLALTYLVLSSPRLRTLAANSSLRLLEACGRHSLEVFTTGCILALFGRLTFRTFGAGLGMQVAVNVVGLATMFLVGLWLERSRLTSLRGAPLIDARSGSR